MTLRGDRRSNHMTSSSSLMPVLKTSAIQRRSPFGLVDFVHPPVPMVSTRSKEYDEPAPGEKRSPQDESHKSPKKQKTQKEGQLEVGHDGEVGLKRETSGSPRKAKHHAEEPHGGKHEKEHREGGDKHAGDEKTHDAKGTEEGEPKQEVSFTDSWEVCLGSDPKNDPVDNKGQVTSSGDETQEPSHGTLESGHIYFLYRPKIETEEVDSVDDISK